MPSVLVLGSSNTDLVIRAARLPAPGETIIGSDYFQAFGGKGANQAVAAARAGADVTFIAAVGDDDFGKAALDQYRREGINVDHVKVVAGQASGVALILVGEDGQNMIAVHPGANHSLTPDDIAALPEEIFASHRVFVAQLETPVETVHAALRRARGAGMFTILNPAPADAAALSDDIMGSIDLIIPNETEAAALTGVAVSDERSACSAAMRLLARDGQAAIVTLGGEGSWAVARTGTGCGMKRIPAVPADAIDTVAAGDAFVGAIACVLADVSSCRNRLDEVVEGAARWASCAAAISVSRRGAQPSLPRREEIEALFHSTGR